MRIPDLKLGLLAATLPALFVAPAMALPTVNVDFESAPPLTLVGPSQPDPSFSESGFVFTPSGGDAQVDLSFCALGAESCISNNGGSYLTAFNGAQVTISSNRWFILESFDASFFPSPLPPGFFSGQAFGLQLNATLFGGGSGSAVVALQEDSWPGDFVFSAYLGALGTSQLTSVTLSACWFDGSGDCVRGGPDFDAENLQENDLAFAIDNLVMAVPEPSAFWMAALGIAAVGARRRKKL